MDRLLEKPLRDTALLSLFPPEAASGNAPPEPDETVLSKDVLRERVAGNRERLQQVLSMAEEECLRLFIELRDALMDADRPRFVRTAHRLTGVLLSLGAGRAAGAARTLEERASMERPAEIEAPFQSLRNELIRLQEEITRLREVSAAEQR
jgi:HPt (histidine-containing phosphotransfer) domain-containing protein